MTALAARTLARQWIDEARLVAGGGPVPVYETVNVSQTPRERVWCTLAFYVELHTGQSYCADYVEEGVVEIHVLGQAGIGDQAVLMAIESIVPEFMTKQDPAGRMVLQETEPLVEAPRGDADPWYRCLVPVRYSWRMMAP